jgi:hypothetical protein
MRSLVLRWEHRAGCASGSNADWFKTYELDQVTKKRPVFCFWLQNPPSACGLEPVDEYSPAKEEYRRLQRCQ